MSLRNFIRSVIQESLESKIKIHHLDISDRGLRAVVWATMEGFHDSIYGKGIQNFYAVPPDFDYTSVVGSVKIYTAGGSHLDNQKINFGSNLRVDPRFRRQGIATTMYKYIENELGLVLSPEPIQEPDGKAFWSTTKWRK